MKWILLILIYGTLQTPASVQKMEFETNAACMKAAEFFAKSPYPAMKIETTCIQDKSE